MMGRPKTSFIVAALFSSAAAAQTVALWRFESGVAGQGVSPDFAIEDQSGCGNDLHAMNSETAPHFSGDVPFEFAAAMNAANRSSLDNTQSPARAREVRGLNAWHRYESDHFFDINRDPLRSWTIEVSVKISEVSGWEKRFETFVGREGYDIPRRDPVEEDLLSALSFKKRGDDNHFTIEIWDAQNNSVVVRSREPAKSGVWYQLAAVNDGQTLSLFIKSPGDEEYLLQGSAALRGGAMRRAGKWTIGRGCFANFPAEQFLGLIDEVRISAAALAPARFLDSSAKTFGPAAPTTAPVEPRPLDKMFLMSIAPTPDNLLNAHDPTLLFDRGMFHIFASHNGIGHWRSSDLIHWEKLEPIFSQPPRWATDDIAPNVGLWAPDAIWFNGKFHVYYSCSRFGSQRSAIGLATNESLDPSNPRYKWNDAGKVIESFPGMAYDAIDASVIVDEHKLPWLAFGSWNDGIFLRQLDSKTGKLSSENTNEYHLISRPIRRAVEAPNLYFHDGWYFLVASYDYCCRGIRSTYKLVVGRSRNVTGPFVDRMGRPMIEGNASLLLRSYHITRGPGQSSFVRAGDQVWLAHHYYDARDEGIARVQMRPVYWDDEGWPLLGEAVGERNEVLPRPSSLSGYWNVLINYDDIDEQQIRLDADGSVWLSDSDGRFTQAGRWTVNGAHLQVTWTQPGGDGTIDRCFVASDLWTFVGRRSDGSIVSAHRAIETK